LVYIEVKNKPNFEITEPEGKRQFKTNPNILAGGDDGDLADNSGVSK